MMNILRCDVFSFSLLALILVIVPATAGTFLADKTTRVSVASDGVQANDYNAFPVISADGRYVAFQSYANNLVPEDSNEALDIIVHDRTSGETSRASLASDGSQGNDSSGNPAISADGRYVAFASAADNLVPGDSNGAFDIFVHDRASGETSRVSLASDGSQASNYSWYSAISASGRYVAFASAADNLVPGDSNGVIDTFVHDRVSHQTTRVSLASDSSQGNSDSWYPAITADGRLVAFQSWADNLVPGGNEGALDIFVSRQK